MRSRYIVFSIAVFSFLYWFDFIISFGQPELNPLYSTTNKFIMFPIIISSVLLLNKFWNPKFKFATIFLISIFAFAFVWNIPVVLSQVVITDSFENTTTENLNYCFRVPIINTCIQDTKAVDIPEEWARGTVFNGSSFGFDIDNIKSTGQTTDGLKSVTLWWIPANNCTIIPNLNSCGLVTQGSASTILKSFELTNENFVMKLDTTVPNFYPIKCEGLFCVDEHYGIACKESDGNIVFQTESECVANGNTPFTIEARGRIIVATTLGTFTVIEQPFDIKLPSQASFREIEIDLEPFFDPADTNITVEFQIVSQDPQFQFPIAWTIDNLRFEEKVLPVSPANPYIIAMTTFTDFPTTLELADCPIPSAGGNACTTASIEAVRISNSFDGVGLLRLNLTETLPFTPNKFGTVDLINFINITFTDGTQANVQVDLEVDTSGLHITSGVDQKLRLTFPIFEFDNIESISGDIVIDFSSAGEPFGDVTYNFTIELDDRLSEIREVFGSVITSDRETITGDPALYGVIILNNEILPNGTHLFSTFNFGNDETTTLNFELRDTNGILKDIHSRSIAHTRFTINNFTDDWITDQTLSNDDIVNVFYETTKSFPRGSDFNSNTSVSFLVAQAVGTPLCESFCSGVTNTTFNRAFQFTSNNITSCVFTIIPNDLNNCPLGIIVVDGVPEEIFAFNQSLTEPVVDLALEGTGFQFLEVFLTPLFIIFITMIGIAGFIEMKIKTNGTGFALAILSLTLFFTFIGVFPISVAIILVIISGLLLVRLLQQQFVSK